MSPPATSERLRNQVKTMAVLCLVLGPSLAGLTLLSVLGKRLVDQLQASALMQGRGLPPYQQISMEFGVQSALVSIPLGAVLMVAGWRAYRDLRRGRAILAVAAGVSVAAMFAYGVLWSVVVERRSGGAAAHLGGWLLHLVQAGAVGSALRFLLRPDVRAACESNGPGAPASEATPAPVLPDSIDR